MNRNTMAKIAKAAKRKIDDSPRTQEDFAKAIGVHPSKLSRWLNRRGKLREEECRALATELQIDIERLEKEAKDELDYHTVSYCPRSDCSAASMFVTVHGVQVKPFFHSPPIEYCPFSCDGQSLRSYCAQQDCEAGIRIGAFRCPHCGTPYLDEPATPPDQHQREEFVAKHMAARSQIVREYLASRRNYGTPTHAEEDLL